jgi:5-methylcytosine-specific restriction endonuclease McrA
MTRGGSTSQWRALRATAFRLYGKSCVKCGENATEIDHILEVANGGTDDLENLQPLCTACHKAKTAQFNSKRRKPMNTAFFWDAPTPRLLSLSYLSPSLTVEPPISQKKEKTSNDR